jgi:hypothetical protein
MKAAEERPEAEKKGRWEKDWFAADGKPLEIPHMASSRITFAAGAVRAGCWQEDQPVGPDTAAFHKLWKRDRLSDILFPRSMSDFFIRSLF